MYRLTVNIGNTHVRFGIFSLTSKKNSSIPMPIKTYKIAYKANLLSQKKLKFDETIVKAYHETIHNDIKKFKPIEVIVVSVVPSLNSTIQTEVGKSLSCPIHFLNHDAFYDLSINYNPFIEMGLDRLVKIKGSRLLYPQKSVMIIDFGTAITIDVIDSQKYLGGMIIPGYTVALQSLYLFTEKLPLLAPTSSSQFLSQSTDRCMTNGTFCFYHQALKGIAEKIMLELFHNQNCKVLITGGDSIFFEKNLPFSPTIIKDFNLVAMQLIARDFHHLT